MPPFRYLVHFSYIGSKYSGVAEQAKQKSTRTIFQSMLRSFEQLKSQPKLSSPLYISSRTDAGVHALHNTANIDLDYVPYETQYRFRHDDFLFCQSMAREMNDNFNQNNDSIKILKIQKVSPNFSARHKAKARTYLFKLAIDKDSKVNYDKYLEEMKGFDFSKIKDRIDKPLNKSCNFLSPFENQFYTPISEPFNYNLFLSAIDIMRGQNNFSAFTTVQGRQDMIKNKRNPVKTLKIQVKLNENESFLDKFHPIEAPRFNCIELTLTAESFLYKMIRKIVGTLMAVANGTLTLQQLKHMFLCPPDFYGNSEMHITTAKPNGLYLMKVHYDENDLVFNESDYVKCSSTPNEE